MKQQIIVTSDDWQTAWALRRERIGKVDISERCPLALALRRATNLQSLVGITTMTVKGDYSDSQSIPDNALVVRRAFDDWKSPMPELPICFLAEVPVSHLGGRVTREQQFLLACRESASQPLELEPVE